MADLESLRELYAWMRDAGVSYARCGELELRIEPQSHAPSPSPDLPPPSPDEDERRSLEELLYSSGADTSVVLRQLRRVA